MGRTSSKPKSKGLTIMANAISANKAELLAIANSVASEKMIDKAIVIEAMEDAIQRAARARYGPENDLRAKLDPETGDLRLLRVVEGVEVGEGRKSDVGGKRESRGVRARGCRRI